MRKADGPKAQRAVSSVSNLVQDDIDPLISTVLGTFV